MKDKLKSEQTAAATSGRSSGARSSAARPQDDADDTFDFLEPPQQEGELGRLGPYRVLKVLGRGGMGVVFKAEDDRLHRPVALKVMLPSVAKRKNARTRFKREALVTAKIEHDHIVTIYEVGEDRELPYLAMQFLKGMTLDDFLKTGRKLKISHIMRIGKEIAKGLAAAHACQLIHRDIKPSNIWLDAANKGRVKILDFGLARPTNEDTELTHQGAIIGTPAFMAPEQARGEVVDARSDLFSLGCVLYRLCAGRFAFNGHDALTVLYAIINEDPPPLEFANPEVPPGLARLVHQLLEKAPADRPASASVVADALQDLERNGTAKTLNDETDTRVEPAKSSRQPVRQTAAHESELSEPDLELETADAPPRKKLALALVLGGLAFASLLGLVVVAGVGYYWFAKRGQDPQGQNPQAQFRQGQIHLVTEHELARELVHDRGITLEDQNKKKFVFKEDAPLPPGNYALDGAALPEGLQVEPKSFTLRRGETQDLKVGLVLLARLEALSLELLTKDNARKMQQEWAKALSRDIVETNRIGMKLVLVPGGVYSMGSTPELYKQVADDIKNLPMWKDRYLKLARSEMPLHKVHITRPFALGMYEVTVEQFQQFVVAEKYVVDVEKSRKGGTGLESGSVKAKPEFTWNRNGFNQTKNHPVSNITWVDAEAFCKWLSKKENKFYRLPTEAEWELACRAGTSTPWHFGDMANAGKYMQHLQAGKALSALTGNHTVGGKLPNDFGLFDMHGNVEEMCSDTWSADYYDKSPFEDPTGPHGDFEIAKQDPNKAKPPFGGFPGGNKVGFDKSKFFKGFGDRDRDRMKFPPPKGKAPDPTKEKVARGGSFLECPQVGRSAFRHAVDATTGQVQIGFRVLCELTLPD